IATASTAIVLRVACRIGIGPAATRGGGCAASVRTIGQSFVGSAVINQRPRARQHKARSSSNPLALTGIRSVRRESHVIRIGSSAGGEGPASASAESERIDVNSPVKCERSCYIHGEHSAYCPVPCRSDRYIAAVSQC